MTTLSPWINFNGNAEEAFTFYKSVFGGEFTQIIRFKDIAGPESKATEEEADKIMQVILRMDGGSVLRGNDVPASMGTVSENENRSKIHVAVTDKEEAERIFDQLSAGGQVEGPLGDSGWGMYFGMLRDRYGIEWIVEFAPAK